ncbi:16S rRNA (guanine(966)-N(2))-methyltransferase RsmD [bacterium]|nr:16S rRNA (guanine(966)-N(2))-methyltransferase RsmD [bacterium]
MKKGPRVISGNLAGLILNVPRNADIRPTTERVRGSLMDIIASDIKGVCFVDAFCGSGIMGMEALSRGASKVIFLDKNPRVCYQLRQICQKKALETRVRIMQVDTQVSLVDILKTQSKVVVYFDPPYQLNILNDILKSISRNNVSDKISIGIIEHHHKVDPMIDSRNWNVFRTARYGETLLTFFKPELLVF